MKILNGSTMSRMKRKKTTIKILKKGLWHRIFHKWTNKLFWIMRIQRPKTKFNKKMNNQKKSKNKNLKNKRDKKKWMLKAKSNNYLKGPSQNSKKGKERLKYLNTRLSRTSMSKSLKV